MKDQTVLIAKPLRAATTVRTQTSLGISPSPWTISLALLVLCRGSSCFTSGASRVSMMYLHLTRVDATEMISIAMRHRRTPRTTP